MCHKFSRSPNPLTNWSTDKAFSTQLPVHIFWEPVLGSPEWSSVKNWGKSSEPNLHDFWFQLLVFPQTGLPVGFYLRKKVTGHAGGRAGPGWARIWLCWARWAVLGRGIWPCWACWAGLGKVVVSVFWFNWFTFTVWGLCWYRFWVCNSVKHLMKTP